MTDTKEFENGIFDVDISKKNAFLLFRLFNVCNSCKSPS